MKDNAKLAFAGTCEAPCSVKFRVHDALGSWMIEDVDMHRMICMTTRERDAKFIADALISYSPYKLLASP